MNLPIGGASATVILFFFQAPAASKPVKADWKEKILQMDPLGTMTIMAAVICYLLALQWGGTTKAWNSSPVIGTLVGFGLFVILFGLVEWKMGERAVLPGSLLGQRAIMVNCVYIFLWVLSEFRSRNHADSSPSFAGEFFALLYYLPIYFQSVDGVSASESGIRNIPLVLGVCEYLANIRAKLES